jgi:hypothetical protein
MKYIHSTLHVFIYNLCNQSQNLFLKLITEYVCYGRILQHFPWNNVTCNYLVPTYLTNRSSEEKEFNKNILSCAHILILSSFIAP